MPDSLCIRADVETLLESGTGMLTDGPGRTEEGEGGVLVGGANSEGRDSASVTHGRLSWRAGGSRTAGHPMGDDAACVAMVTGLCPGRL